MQSGKATSMLIEYGPYMAMAGRSQSASERVSRAARMTDHNHDLIVKLLPTLAAAEFGAAIHNFACPSRLSRGFQALKLCFNLEASRLHSCKYNVDVPSSRSIGTSWS